MSISCLIYNTTIKKLADFKDVHKFTSNYQVVFDKIIGFLTNSFYYTHQSTKMYFQITMLINIRIKYSAFISAIQKDQKDKTINLIKIVLQIIKHMEGNKKNNKVIFQISARLSRLSSIASKRFCKNQKYIDKGLTIDYTNYYQIKQPKLR